jgi:putative RecB family exonuclease
MPSDLDIDRYFGEVENALRSHGVRPASPAVTQKALRVLKLFNRIEGPLLYPRVFDTEYRLESDRGQYILRGVVDVLAIAPGVDGDPSKMEIWDYKGTKMPNLSSKELQDYGWQMCVYAELYRVRSGVYPAKAVLYFLNELDQNPEPQSRPLRAVHEVNFTQQMIHDALAEFNLTANQIIACQANMTWPIPAHDPGKETCDICDIRWNCPKKKGGYPLRLPI